MGDMADISEARIISTPMAVAALGIQAVLVDRSGAALGAWQAGTPWRQPDRGSASQSRLRPRSHERQRRDRRAAVSAGRFDLDEAGGRHDRSVELGEPDRGKANEEPTVLGVEITIRGGHQHLCWRP
jgi:hypothetical protein